MTKASLYGIIMIYIAFSIFLYAGGVRVVAEDTSAYLGKFIDLNSYENGTIVASDGFENSVPTSFSESGSGTGLSFIDSLGAVGTFLIFLTNLLFSPIGLFTGAGLPPMVALFIAVPLLVSGVIAFIVFLRSGN